ncbi:MAG: helix-turn-helix domain-containing protein [Thiobacillus sp.]
MSDKAAMQQRLSTSNQVGQVLAARRSALKLSQKTVASRLGVSQSRLSELETDPSRLTLDRLISLANLLGLEVVIQDKARSTPQGEW